MIVIGERINGNFDVVAEGIKARDKKAIYLVAEKQLATGSNILDINVGTRVAKAERLEVMKWLVETTREVTNVPLAIDSPNYEVVRAGVEAASKKGRAIINSTTGAVEPLEKFMTLAHEFKAGIVCLAIDEKGVAGTVDGKVEIGMRAVAVAMEKGVAVEDIYLDPIILPVNCNQTAPRIVLEAIQQFKMISDPAPHIVIGLSNLSQGASERSLINRSFFVMAIAMGLDSCIMDSQDTDLMHAMIAAEMLLDKSIYSDSFIKAYLQSHSTSASASA